jgi:ubiquinone/menaquinone biosynthesis C-methylase UbiE
VLEENKAHHMLKENKTKLKEYFYRSFSKPNQVEYWHDVYNRQDFIGLCYRKRMNTALNWIDNLKLPKKSKVLDAGCGAGLAVNKIFKRGYKTFGIDYSFEMLEISKNACSALPDRKAVFLQADLESLPFKDSSFDAVICIGVVAYLSNLDKAFIEFARILKPNGFLVLSIVNKARLINRLDIPFLIKNQILKISLKYKFPCSKINEEAQNLLIRKSYSIHHIINVMQRYGFLVSEYKTVPFGLLTFLGKEIMPRNLNLSITMFFEKFINIPVIGSFGGMVLFKAKRMANEK